MSGASESTQKYYPFGGTRPVSTLNPPTDKLYTGHQKEGSLYFMQSRFYDPTLGRFLQPDSIVPEPGNPQALNRYSYVVNNPLLYTDPTGYCWLCDAAEAVGGWVSSGVSTGVDFFTVTLPNGAGIVGNSALDLQQQMFQMAMESPPAQTVRDAGLKVVNAVSSGAGAVQDAAEVAAPVVADYVADKGQDIGNLGVRWAAVTLITGSPYIYPLIYPQDILALGISLGSVGNRHSGSWGFAMYTDCRGLCSAIPIKNAYTPGFLAFDRGPYRKATFDHENQHGFQALVMGPAYQAVTQGYYASCGWKDPCMHTRSPLEVDAIRAQTEGVHFPGFLLP